MENVPYSRVVGSLMYSMVFSRADIMQEPLQSYSSLVQLPLLSEACSLHLVVVILFFHLT